MFSTSHKAILLKLEHIAVKKNFRFSDHFGQKAFTLFPSRGPQHSGITAYIFNTVLDETYLRCITFQKTEITLLLLERETEERAKPIVFHFHKNKQFFCKE